MNSYELSRAWFDFSFENPNKVKPIHTAMYFFAIEHCNRLGWKKNFGFPTTMAMEALGIGSYNTYTKALSELIDFGFIILVEKSRNQHSSNIIALSINDKATNKALDKALIKHSTKHSESTVQSIEQSIDSIDKQITINKETINKEQRTKLKDLHLLLNDFFKESEITEQKIFTIEIVNCFNTCLNHFESHLQPKTPKQKESWLETIEKLNRIDNIPFEKIEEIVSKTRADDFWSKNFLSLTKLRKKNTDGIMYIIVFNEKIKSNNGKKESNSTTEERAGEAFARYFSKENS